LRICGKIRDPGSISVGPGFFCFLLAESKYTMNKASCGAGAAYGQENMRKKEFWGPDANGS
jgi:hypothetical protein